MTVSAANGVSGVSVSLNGDENTGLLADLDANLDLQDAPRTSLRLHTRADKPVTHLGPEELGSDEDDEEDDALREGPKVPKTPKERLVKTTNSSLRLTLPLCNGSGSTPRPSC